MTLSYHEFITVKVKHTNNSRSWFINCLWSLYLYGFMSEKSSSKCHYFTVIDVVVKYLVFFSTYSMQNSFIFDEIQFWILIADSWYPFVSISCFLRRVYTFVLQFLNALSLTSLYLYIRLLSWIQFIIFFCNYICLNLKSIPSLCKR